jgi:hypothetical protein
MSLWPFQVEQTRLSTPTRVRAGLNFNTKKRSGAVGSRRAGLLAALETGAANSGFRSAATLTSRPLDDQHPNFDHKSP